MNYFTDPGTHDARAVANYYLDRAAADDRVLDPLKLQKLVYYAHGWHLGLQGRPLIWQTVFAWPHGPVVKAVYDAFKVFKGRPIGDRATFLDPESKEWRPYTAELSPETEDVLEQVWEAYGPFTGWQLREMSHAEGTPWHQVAGHLPEHQIRNLAISNERIKSYFAKKAAEQKAAEQLAAAM